MGFGALLMDAQRTFEGALLPDENTTRSMQTHTILYVFL